MQRGNQVNSLLGQNKASLPQLDKKGQKVQPWTKRTSQTPWAKYRSKTLSRKCAPHRKPATIQVTMTLPSCQLQTAPVSTISAQQSISSGPWAGPDVQFNSQKTESAFLFISKIEKHYVLHAGNGALWLFPPWHKGLSWQITLKN